MVVRIRDIKKNIFIVIYFLIKMFTLIIQNQLEMIKYETLSRRKMIQQYKKNQTNTQKEQKSNYSRTMEMSPFTNQNYFTHKILYRPTSASLNGKALLSNTLKKSNYLKKLLNQSKDHRIESEDFVRISEKFTESYKNKNKAGNQKKFFNHFWQNQLEKQSNKKANNAQNKQKIEIKIKGAIQSQSSKINSFEQFIQSRKRIQTKKKSHTRTKSQSQNKSTINKTFQVFGKKKEVQFKQRFIDGKKCQNSSLEYKQLYKKYLQKLVQEQTEHLRQARPSSALDSTNYQLQGLNFDTQKKSQHIGILTEQKDQKISKLEKYQEYLIFNHSEKKVPTRKMLLERSKKFSNQLIQKHYSFKTKKEHVVVNELQGWKGFNQEQFDFLI